MPPKMLPLLWLLLTLMVGCQSQPQQPPPLPTPTLVAALAPSASASATATASPAASRTPRPSATVPAPSATSSRTPRPSATAPAPSATASAPAPAPALSAAALPAQLRIPRLGVQAAVEFVGQDAQGRMDVPVKVENVAWYQLGPRPGAAGNAVMSGHLDDYKQEPAIFWRLNELEVGDELVVVDDAGQELRFRVTGKELYPYDQAPMTRIFGFAIGSHLNLITCNGTWDSRARNYDQRLVIYSERVR